MQRRPVLQCLVAGGVLTLAGRSARASGTPGVTATEVKIGNTSPLSGPVSALGMSTRAEAAYFQMINDRGGVAGRKINFIYYDDGYSPPRTVEHVRKLVEEDGVAFLFSTIGTATSTAIRPYCNRNKVPQLFVFSGAEKFSEPQHFPWTIGFNPSNRMEAQIYGKYISREKPDARGALLYQNDDFGKDYLDGLKDGFGDKFAKIVV